MTLVAACSLERSRTLNTKEPHAACESTEDLKYSLSASGIQDTRLAESRSRGEEH